MSNLESSLEVFANKFKSWRKNKTHTKYPKHFWSEIYHLARNIPISNIAQALGVNVAYLKARVSKHKKDAVTFAPVKISSSASFSLEFQDKNDKKITLKFQASHDDLVRLIRSLS